MNCKPLNGMAAPAGMLELPKGELEKGFSNYYYTTGVKMRVIRSKHPGLYIRGYVCYRSRWVKWVGCALLPLGRGGRRWLGLALEIPTKKRTKAGVFYRKHDPKNGQKYPVSYDPETREVLENQDYNKKDTAEGGKNGA